MFKFKGITNQEMGVFAKEENFLGKAPINYEEIQIDGRDGQDIIPMNYNNFISNLNNVVLMKDNIDEVLGWLNGKGELEYNGRVTNIQFLETYGLNTMKRPTSISFVRDPFWYKKDDSFVTATSSITNDGNVPSKPIIKLTKGTIEKNEFRVNGVQFIYTFPIGEEYVEIDCKEMNAFYDGFYRNNNLEIGFDFPALDIGENTVSRLQGDATISFKRKDVWL